VCVYERVGVSVRVWVRVRKKGGVSVYVWESVRVCERVCEGEDVFVWERRVFVW
jgi:hypothetical protein